MQRPTDYSSPLHRFLLARLVQAVDRSPITLPRDRHDKSLTRRSSHTHRKRSSWSSSSTRSSKRDYSPTLMDRPPSRVSPIDDINTFHDVLSRGAQKLNIGMSAPQASTSVIFEILHQNSVSRPLLPLVHGLLQPVMDIFLTPASIDSSCENSEKIQTGRTGSLISKVRSPPDLLIIAAAKKTHATSSSSSVPPDKESRAQDSWGRKACGSAAASLKVSSAAALLGRYDR